MICCEKMSEYIEASNQSKPFKSMEQMHCYTKHWCDLKRCPNCGQLWVVDEWDKYQLLVAFKVPAFPSKEQIEGLVQKYHEKLAVDKHGGYSDKKCKWTGCKNFALKNKYVCYKHS